MGNYMLYGSGQKSCAVFKKLNANKTLGEGNAM